MIGHGRPTGYLWRIGHFGERNGAEVIIDGETDLNNRTVAKIRIALVASDTSLSEDILQPQLHRYGFVATCMGSAVEVKSQLPLPLRRPRWRMST